MGRAVNEVSEGPRGLGVLDSPTLAEVRCGLSASFLEDLRDALDVSETQLADVVGDLIGRMEHGIPT